ncbi:hypothetical protein BFN03_05145 [Rhodococcus sp. WMMA185]|uniref:hypothetical protein n=1 Tax=Rhodococcus sp. WMMA185 TaxID=679318 RepID=UPI0008780352|nr:hypothetical protein [Rhodococcus sp. WMMA185]AOW92300.1 hypothetical protein BFN03_05145 [Rhodococcus sp. WMMA185]
MSISLNLPPGFARIPIDGDLDARIEAAQSIAALADRGSADPATVAEAVLATGDMLRSNGTILAGQLALPETDPSVHAMVTLSTRRLGDGGPELPDLESRVESARAIAKVLSHQNPHATVQYRDLGCGPVVLILRAGHFQLPSDVTVTGESIEIPTDTFQAILPTPDGNSLLVFDMSTSAREHWHHFLPVAMSMVNGIRVDGSPNPAEPLPHRNEDLR